MSSAYRAGSARASRSAPLDPGGAAARGDGRPVRAAPALAGRGPPPPAPAPPLGAALALSLLGGLADAGTVGLCLAAGGVSQPLHAWILLVLVGRASSLVPTTPGSLDVQEGAQVLALGLLGVPTEPALSFALLCHMAHLVPVPLVGTIEARGHL